MEAMKKLASETQDIISKLQQDLANSTLELKERENRINDRLQVEVLMEVYFLWIRFSCQLMTYVFANSFQYISCL